MSEVIKEILLTFTGWQLVCVVTLGFVHTWIKSYLLKKPEVQPEEVEKIAKELKQLQQDVSRMSMNKGFNYE
jgi:hypothetical protein